MCEKFTLTRIFDKEKCVLKPVAENDYDADHIVIFTKNSIHSRSSNTYLNNILEYMIIIHEDGSLRSELTPWQYQEEPSCELPS